jgi:hypothetical protein
MYNVQVLDVQLRIGENNIVEREACVTGDVAGYEDFFLMIRSVRLCPEVTLEAIFWGGMGPKRKIWRGIRDDTSGFKAKEGFGDAAGIKTRYYQSVWLRQVL